MQNPKQCSYCDLSEVPESLIGKNQLTIEESSKAFGAHFSKNLDIEEITDLIWPLGASVPLGYVATTKLCTFSQAN